MNHELSFVELVINASFVVQFVMLVLLAASIFSWTFIFYKLKQIKRAFFIAEEFEREFWSGVDITELYRKLATEDINPEGIEKIFIAGYKEFSRMHQKTAANNEIKIASAQKAMQIELARELEKLEENLPFLATVGSTSPYIGLFGTVWGIMTAFKALGDVKQATLVQVAPGIAEALIATAIGLFAAIPAVIAYNRFAARLDKLAGRYELFIDEFTVLLQRQVYSR